VTIAFTFTHDVTGGSLSIVQPRRGWLAALRARPRHDLTHLPREEREVAMALARLHVLDRDGREHSIEEGAVRLSHRLLSEVDGATARVLGLPPLVTRYVFKAAMRGSLGNPDFRLDWWWEKGGKVVALRRVGAVIEGDTGLMRLPSQIYRAIGIAEAFDPTRPLQDHWLVLGDFRRALGIESSENGGRIDLEGALEAIEIVTCDRVGLAVDPDDDTAFDVAPFIGDKLTAGEQPGMEQAPISGDELGEFQRQAKERGAQPAYALGKGRFVILERSAMPVVDAIAEAAKGAQEERRAFIRDAERIIAEAIERRALEDGRLNELMSPEGYAEALEREIGRAWTETREWSSRVIAIAEWKRPTPQMEAGSGTVWLPDTTIREIGELLGTVDDDEVEALLADIGRAIADGRPSVTHRVGTLPATPEVFQALARRLEEIRRKAETTEAGDPRAVFLPITLNNFWDEDFRAASRRRGEDAQILLPDAVTTPLKPHQIRAFEWQVEAWRFGLPGILDADEQGLGKTLQTLAFLTWLADRMVDGAVPMRPTLIVAPTSLLRNWETELETHVRGGIWAEPVRLYGPHLAAWKADSIKGRDIDDGKARLDLSELVRATRPSLVITTYQTMANYAVTFSQTDFAVAVFDEIQNLKNPFAMRSEAARAVMADFKIGLTGTPVENATRDIWAILDQLFPLALGPLAEFRRVFDVPEERRMRQLHSAIFVSQGGRPPLGLRRLKKDVATDLPPKVRILHPRIMPEVQAIRYDEIRAKGGTLFELLHHIRRTSLHPGLVESEVPESFTTASARLSAAMDILGTIRARGERALVFVENRDVQAWFAELVKIEFSLERVWVINGDTPIDARKEITDRFQRHLTEDRGFDVLVMGPRAAGTGLTLTAANHVIHLTRWWNPAVEEQCNDRTHRIGQTRPVTIHIPLAIHPRLGRGSFDCLLQRLMKRKRGLAEAVLWPQESDGAELLTLYQTILDPEDGAEPVTGDLSLADRPDLLGRELGPNLVRVTAKAGGASILIGLTDAPETVMPHATASDAAVIVMGANTSEAMHSGIPVSLLPDMSLWSDYVLPE
jgi:hypothetical protein